MHTIKWTFSISKTNEEDPFSGKKKKLLNKNRPLYLLILPFSIYPSFMSIALTLDHLEIM